MWANASLVSILTKNFGETSGSSGLPTRFWHSRRTSRGEALTAGVQTIHAAKLAVDNYDVSPGRGCRCAPEAPYETAPRCRFQRPCCLPNQRRVADALIRQVEALLPCMLFRGPARQIPLPDHGHRRQRLMELVDDPSTLVVGDGAVTGLSAHQRRRGCPCPRQQARQLARAETSLFSPLRPGRTALSCSPFEHRQGFLCVGKRRCMDGDIHRTENVPGQGRHAVLRSRR